MAEGMRERIIRVATDLLVSGGRDAVTTRAVSAAAGVQPPTIYRQFGDMRGLLNAVLVKGFDDYLERKAAQADVDDPVEALRRGWDLHIGFGLEQPAMYMLLYGEPHQGLSIPSLATGIAMLRQLVDRVAARGGLRVSPEQAVAMIHAAGVGVTLTMLERPPSERDPLVGILTREAIIGAIMTDAGEGRTVSLAARPDPVPHAIALRTMLADDPLGLTDAERALLGEWLVRIGAGES